MKTMNQPIRLLTLLLATSLPATAYNAEVPGPLPMPLSLEDAVLMALEDNPDLLVQAFEPLVAGSFLQRERARFAPVVFASASRRESRSSETARATGEQFDAEVEQFRLAGGVSKPLATGSEVALQMMHASEISNRAPDQEESRASLSFTQALLQGGGRTVNLAGVRRAEFGLAISEAELRGYTEFILAETEAAYWRFWLATETIDIARQALDVAQQQLHDVEQRIEVGQLARNEAAVAQAEVARRRQTLIDAQADLVRRRIELGMLIAPAQPHFHVRPSSTPDVPSVDETDTPDMRIELADQNRADLQEARYRLEQSKLDTVITRNGLLPRLEFFAELSKSGFGASASDAWADLNGNSYDWQTGLRFRHPLGRTQEKALDAESRFREAQARQAIENLRQQIAAGVHLALNELKRAQEQVDASAETHRLQIQTVESEVERFQVGTGTALMVAQAQRDLLSSMVAEKQAVVQARLALLQLYRAEGSLLARRGIRLDP